MNSILFRMCMLTLVTGCSVVGDGEETLVKAGVPANDRIQLNGVFSHILIEDSVAVEQRLVPMTPGAPDDYEEYRNFIGKKYSDPSFEAANLDVTIRNRSITPPFLPIDLKSLMLGKIAELALDEKATAAQKIEREEFLRARLLDVPSLSRTTTLHHIEETGPNIGRKVFYYYPRLNLAYPVNAHDRYM